MLSVTDLVDDITAEIVDGWGEDSLNRGAVLTILLERIVSGQLADTDLRTILIELDKELSARGL